VATKDKQPMGWYKGSGFMGWDQENIFSPETDIDANMLMKFIADMSPAKKDDSAKRILNGEMQDMPESYAEMEAGWVAQEKKEIERRDQNEAIAKAEQPLEEEVFDEKWRQKYEMGEPLADVIPEAAPEQIPQEDIVKETTAGAAVPPAFKTIYSSAAGIAVPDAFTEAEEELKTLDEEELKKLEEEDEIKEAIESEDIDYEQLRSEEIDAELAELFKDTEMTEEIEHLTDDQKKMLLEQRKELAKETKAGAAVPEPVVTEAIYEPEGLGGAAAMLEGEEKLPTLDNEIFKAILSENLPRIGGELLDNKVALKRLEIFSKFIQEMESDFNPKAKNPKSTAAGLYQFTKDTMDTVLNRLERITGKGNLPDWAIEAKKHKDARKLSEERQTLLFYVHMFQQKGSDKLLKKIMEDGDMDAVVEYYSKLHHTNVDKDTQDRVDKIRKKYNLKDVK